MRCLILMRNFLEGYKQVCLAAVHVGAICNVFLMALLLACVG